MGRNFIEHLFYGEATLFFINFIGHSAETFCREIGAVAFFLDVANSEQSNSWMNQ